MDRRIRNDGPDEAVTLGRMARSLQLRDGRTTSTSVRAGAGLASVGSERTSCVVEADGLTLAAFGHLRCRDSKPGADLREAATAFLRAYRRDGTGALNRLNGDFAIALHDSLNGDGLLAVDRIGMRNLTYCWRGDRLLFGSSIACFALFPQAELRLDRQALYDYVFFHVVPGPQTIYRGVKRVPPGHYIEYDGTATLPASAYWRMRFVEDRSAPLAQLKAEFVETLQSATAAAAAGANCGAFLSGGTDSSTVSGLLGRVSGQPAATFSIGFAASGYDEMDYARTTAHHFRTRHHEYYVTPDDVVAAAPRIAAAYDQPFGNASAIPTFYCAKLANQHGVERLLAGDGGDELYGGNARYAKQRLLALYGRLPHALRKRALEPLLLHPGFPGRLPLLRKLRSYVEQAALPMPQRYESSNLVEHIGANSIFQSDFLAQIDPDHPHALMREAHVPFAGCSIINQMLGIDLRFVLADGDLPKVTTTCELAGVDVAFPMLDHAVVSFSESLPPEFKLRGTQLRWFFKESLRGFLPDETLAKKKQGFGLPVGIWLTTHRPLLELARASLDRLRTRGIVRPDFIDKLFAKLLHEHPAYYGTLIWVFMLLELWIQSRPDGGRDF